MADVFGRNSTQLAILGSRVQAGMGLGYAISSLVGGPLAARDIRYAYAASCTLGCCVLACVGFGLRETLPADRRTTFVWKGATPLAFTRLFSRGALSAKLNLVVVLQVRSCFPNSLAVNRAVVARRHPSLTTCGELIPSDRTPLTTSVPHQRDGRSVASPRARAAWVGRGAVRTVCGARRHRDHGRDSAHRTQHTTPGCPRSHRREHECTHATPTCAILTRLSDARDG